jgi:hypothetical protein
VSKLPILFGKIISRVKTQDFHHHISEFSSDVLAPRVSSRPGQLPEWPAPLCSKTTAFIRNKRTSGKECGQDRKGSLQHFSNSNCVQIPISVLKKKITYNIP